MTFLFLLPYQLRIAHACPVDVLRPTHHRDMLGAPASRFSCRSVLALAVFEVRVSPAGPRACGIIGICVKVYSQRLNELRSRTLTTDEPLYLNHEHDNTVTRVTLILYIIYARGRDAGASTASGSVRRGQSPNRKCQQAKNERSSLLMFKQ